MKKKHTTLQKAAGAFALLAFAQVSQGITFFEGHGDFAVGFEDGEFEFGFHLGEDGDSAFVNENGVISNVGGSANPDGEEFEPDEIEVLVNTSLVVAPGASTILLDATGATVGSTLYLLSQDASGTGDIIFGFGNEGLVEIDGVSEWSDVNYTLLNADGPGDFSVYFNNGGTDDFTVDISTAEGIDQFSFPAGEHSERNWAFTAPGTYNLTFRAESTFTENGTSEDFSSEGVFTFVVVPEPSSALLLALSGLGLLGIRRRA